MDRAARPCACCDEPTIRDEGDGCPLCHWIADAVQESDPIIWIGPNRMSLREARNALHDTGSIYRPTFRQRHPLVLSQAASLTWVLGGFLLFGPVGVVIGEILFDWRQVELPRDLVWALCAPIGVLLMRAARRME